MELSGKTYWLVGASEGLGRALAQELDRRGARLVLSARSQERLNDLADTLDHPAKLVPLDVTDTGAVNEAFENAGPIDGVVYIAGLYEPMRAQDWDARAVEAMCNVNFMGAVRVMGAVVPTFVKRDRGHIVLIGSLSGYRGLPAATGYGASKAGMMHMAESLQTDLCKTNVKVQLMNPGFIRTRLTDKNDFKMPFILSPEDAANRIAVGMNSKRFKIDFPFAFSLVFRASRFLPQKLYELVFAGDDRG